MIHNHGTEQCAGLACREIMTPEGMVGLCQVRITVSCINWSCHDPGVPKAEARFYRADTGTPIGFPAYRATHEEALRWALSTARKTWPPETQDRSLDCD
ncbi:hypothetical protein [Micrococcus terreus]|uniref:hypothetical protein n=1 Tax=Micrococcus terreus TaxID=574650 RepID=UPI003D710B9D